MTKISRRTALRGLGGLLVSLPVLEGCTGFDGLWSAPSRDHGVAATRESLVATPAKRFIAQMCPNGVEPAFWYPTGSGRDFTLNAQNAALEEIRAHLILTRGIANKVAIDGFTNGHVEGVCSLLSGWSPRDLGGGTSAHGPWEPGGPSIDQRIARLHATDGYVGRVTGIHLGEEAAGAYSSISVGEDLSFADYTWNLDVLFDSPGSETEHALELARARRRSILDGTRADFASLAPRVSGEDRRRIEAHLEALRSIETRLAEAPSCSEPDLPAVSDGDQRRDLMQDIVVAAMACDATRIATLVFHHSGGGGPTLPWLGIHNDIHELSHQVVSTGPDHPSHAEFTAYHDWWSRKTVRFVRRLQETPMPGGSTLFDETVLFQGSEIEFDHTTPEMPFVIVAGERTPFATGRFVDVRPRALHTHLLVTMLHAFGDDATHVGDPAYPPGDLDDVFFNA